MWVEFIMLISFNIHLGVNFVAMVRIQKENTGKLRVCFSLFILRNTILKFDFFLALTRKSIYRPEQCKRLLKQPVRMPTY
jgi:hypothetical protein